MEDCVYHSPGTLISHRPNVEDMEAANKIQGLESGMARSLALLDRVESVKASGNLTTEEIYAHLRAIYNITRPADDDEVRYQADATLIAYGGNRMFFGDPKKKKKNTSEAGLGLTATQIAFNEIAVPIALAEPSPFGEAIVSVVNIFFLVDNMSEKIPEGKIRPLTQGEIKMMQDKGVDPHDLKPQQGNGNKIDLFRDQTGDIYFNIKNSSEYHCTYYNWYNIVK